jgi:hypothetical protein
MLTDSQLQAYMSEIREEVCGHCIDRPPQGPPCAPRGKRCGIEMHLAQIVQLTHAVRNQAIDPYLDHLHVDICRDCPIAATDDCPCPLEYLLVLAIQAIETVDPSIEEYEPAS